MTEYVGSAMPTAPTYLDSRVTVGILSNNTGPVVPGVGTNRPPKKHN